MKTHSEAFLRRRRFLLVLPLLLLPFLTLAFWALGGGTQPPAGTTGSENPPGLSLKLPEPQFKEKESPDKLTLYNQAKRALQKQKKTYEGNILGRLDLTGNTHSATDGAITAGDPVPSLESTFPAAGNTQAGQLSYADQNEEKVNRRLAQLTRLVNTRPGPPGPAFQGSTPATPQLHDERFRRDINKLEEMMTAMGGGSAADPGMQQLEHMLERILDIQHPERVRAKLREPSPEKQEQAFALQQLPDQASITLLEPSLPASVSPSSASPPLQALQDEAASGFHTLEGVPDTAAGTSHLIQAAVHETRTLASGDLLQVRLLQDLYIQGIRVGKGSLLYGTCRVNGERLAIEFTSLRTRHTILPVRLEAFDLDGLPGLAIPGSATRDAARQGADRAISQTLQLPILGASFGARAAGAGIEAAKGLLRRQGRQVKVTVKAGYRLLLREL